MKKTHEKQTRFGVRLSPGEAIQLEAIARKLNISKSEVLRLSLSAEAGRKSTQTDAAGAVLSESLDAVSLRMRALDDRVKSMENLLGSAVDLLLSLSRNGQPSATQPAPEKTQTGKQATAAPSWAEYTRKNIKTNPIMSNESWLEFLKNRYTEQHGHPPDLSS